MFPLRGKLAKAVRRSSLSNAGGPPVSAAHPSSVAGKKELWKAREASESSTGRIWLDKGGAAVLSTATTGSTATADSATAAWVEHAANASVGTSPASNALVGT